MCIFMIGPSVKLKRLSEVETAIEKAFAAIAVGQPEGVRSAREMSEIRAGLTDQESRSVGPRATASMTTRRHTPGRWDLTEVVHDG